MVELNCFVIFQNKTSFRVQVSLMMGLCFIIADMLDVNLRLLIKCDISLRRALNWSMLLYDSLSGVMFESRLVGWDISSFWNIWDGNNRGVGRVVLSCNKRGIGLRHKRCLRLIRILVEVLGLLSNDLMILIAHHLLIFTYSNHRGHNLLLTH